MTEHHPQLQLRPLQFHLDAEPSTWHGAGRDISLFFNVLSTFFPEGEKFFIQSAQYYRDRIEDPQLKEDLRLFSGQEGLHRREHDRYNERLQEAGYPTKMLDRRVHRNLVLMHRWASPRRQLAMTCALEHFTAVLADALLSDERIIENSDPGYAAIWRWHAIEETEHKAVCYDIYQAVGGGWLLRSFVMLTTTLGFLTTILYHMHVFLKAEGRAWRPGPWWNVFHWLWVRPGAAWRAAWNYLQYYKPGFHPWQHDNHHHLDRFYEGYADFVAAVERAPAQSSATNGGGAEESPSP